MYTYFGENRAAAEAFLEQSDSHNIDTLDVYYNGDHPERAFTIRSVNITFVVDTDDMEFINPNAVADGKVVAMSTGEFIGGVLYSLAEQGIIDETLNESDICLHLGHMLGQREARDGRWAMGDRTQPAEATIVPTNQQQPERQF